MPMATNRRLPDLGASVAGAAAGGPAGLEGTTGASAGRRLVSSATWPRSCSPKPDVAWPDVSASALSASGRITRAAWSLVTAIPASPQTQYYGGAKPNPASPPPMIKLPLTERFGQDTLYRDEHKAETLPSPSQ